MSVHKVPSVKRSEFINVLGVVFVTAVVLCITALLAVGTYSLIMSMLGQCR
jgi:hypothetical protein